MFKVLICDCKRFGLDQLNVKYKSSFYLGCSCSVKHKIFATKCEKCLYNVVGFSRNYFPSINCSCQFINKDVLVLTVNNLFTC